MVTAAGVDAERVRGEHKPIDERHPHEPHFTPWREPAREG
jgi:hypothetical protein